MFRGMINSLSNFISKPSFLISKLIRKNLIEEPSHIEKTKMGKKFHINQSTGIPLYKQVVSHIEQQIISGELVVESGLKRYTAQDTLNQLFDSLDPTK